MEQSQQLTKNTENGYYLVKWTSDSYIVRSSHKIVKDVIKYGYLVCDAVYLNTLANFKQWYTTYEKLRKTNQVEYFYSN